MRNTKPVVTSKGLAVNGWFKMFVVLAVNLSVDPIVPAVRVADQFPFASVVPLYDGKDDTSSSDGAAVWACPPEAWTNSRAMVNATFGIATQSNEATLTVPLPGAIVGAAVGYPVLVST